MSTLHLMTLWLGAELAVIGIAAALVLVCRVAGAWSDRGRRGAVPAGVLGAALPTGGHG